MKRLLVIPLLLFSFNAKAFDAVVDIEAIVSNAMQLEQLAQTYGVETKQLSNLLDQLQQAKMAYDAISGVTNIGNISPMQLVNLQSLYPAVYDEMVKVGYGLSKQIAEQNQLLPISETAVLEDSYITETFEDKRNQVPLNKAQFMEAYEDANQQYSDLGLLLDELKMSPDLKTSMDINARVGLTMAAFINDQKRLFAMAEMNKTQEGLAEQRWKEGNMMVADQGIPRFGAEVIY